MGRNPSSKGVGVLLLVALSLVGCASLPEPTRLPPPAPPPEPPAATVPELAEVEWSHPESGWRWQRSPVLIRESESPAAAAIVEEFLGALAGQTVRAVRIWGDYTDRGVCYVVERDAMRATSEHRSLNESRGATVINLEDRAELEALEAWLADRMRRANLGPVRVDSHEGRLVVDRTPRGSRFHPHVSVLVLVPDG